MPFPVSNIQKERLRRHRMIDRPISVLKLVFFVVAKAFQRKKDQIYVYGKQSS